MGTPPSVAPLPPPPVALPPDEKRRRLRENLIEALYALPGYFTSELAIRGVLATDLHTFNTSLGATIEEQVVGALNKLRTTWDPHDEWALYSFARQSQQFPDVILRTSSPTTSSAPAIGIELKGWYAIAKEAEPSLRFQATPAVCTPWDLIAVVPWALDGVISGSPRLFTPWIESARYAAEYRNWHWEFVRDARGSAARGVILSPEVDPYPSKDRPISDKAVSDGGNNFGRLARTGLLKEFVDATDDALLSGIPVRAWRRFLAIFQDEFDPAELERGLRSVAGAVAAKRGGEAALQALAAVIVD